MKDVVKESMPKKDYQRIAVALVVFGIISSIMLYAGFTSAVVVSKMDKFWVDINLPYGFTISTVLIVLSSISLVVAYVEAKKNKVKLVSVFTGLSLFLGIAFGVSQFKAWGELVEQGNYIADKIFFDYGAYGSEYTLLKDGKEIYFDGYDYYLDGKKMSKEEVQEIKGFLHQIAGDKLRVDLAPYEIENYGKPYSIKNVEKDEVLQFENGKAILGGEPLSVSQRDELFKFAFGVYHDMPFFMLKGRYGEDFSLYLNGERLDFEDRKLYFPERELTVEEIQAIKKTVFQGGKEYEIKNGKVYLEGKEIPTEGFETYFDLNKGIQVHIKNGKWTQLRQELNSVQYGEFYQTGNVASSYVWILTIVHFIHVLVGLLVLFVLFIRSLKGIYNKENQMGLVVGGVFWHFLGFLWIYLFVFLQLIH